MAILIKEMQMPWNCRKCKFAYHVDGYGPLTGCGLVEGKKYAAIEDKEYSSYAIPTWCPLEEVADEHTD